MVITERALRLPPFPKQLKEDSPTSKKSPELGFQLLTFGKPVGRSPHSSTERSLKVFSFSKQNLTDLSILRCNKLSTNISSGWLAFYDLGTKKSFKKLGKFMALVTFEVTN